MRMLGHRNWHTVYTNQGECSLSFFYKWGELNRHTKGTYNSLTN